MRLNSVSSIRIRLSRRSEGVIPGGDEMLMASAICEIVLLTALLAAFVATVRSL